VPDAGLLFFQQTGLGLIYHSQSAVPITATTKIILLLKINRLTAF
jgi:hypothetical protein